MATACLGDRTGLVYPRVNPYLNIWYRTGGQVKISYPLFVAAFAWLLFRQPVEWPVLVGGVFIFVGSAMIVTWN